MSSIDFYKQFSEFTNPGLYQDELRKLPDDIAELGKILRQNFIHRTSIEVPEGRQNPDKRFGDLSNVPWWRQPEDDVLQTAGAMLTELYRRDGRGLVIDRAVEDKLVLTCRYVAIMTASILKAKGIPARVRAGHADYFDMGSLGSVSTDHWINQYWSDDQKRWVTIDIDGSLSIVKDVNPFDVKPGQFDFAADAWLGIRDGSLQSKHFYNAGGYYGLIVVAWSLFYDFHCLMNSEMIYMHHPQIMPSMSKLPENLEEIDELARLMSDPDTNLKQLQDIWENQPDFRLLKGSLL